MKSSVQSHGTVHDTSARGITVPAPSAPKAARPATRQPFYRPELDVLRFFAFFGVFLTHTIDRPANFFSQHHFPPFLAVVVVGLTGAGQYGVDLFFVLSSYLITELLLREKEQCGSLDVRLFYLRRILRIWPVYYFVLLLTVIFPSFDPTHAFGLKYLLPFLLLAGNWAFVAFGWPEHVAASPLWSISVEEQFYLFWPPVVARLSRRQITYAALGMILLANLIRVLMLVSSGSRMALWGNTFAHLDSIAAGILVAIVLRGRAPSVGPASRFALVFCAVVCVTSKGYFQQTAGDGLSWGTTLLGWPVIAVSCSMILFAFIGLKVEQPWFQYLGKISYGLYAYHVLCVVITDKLLATWHRLPEHSALHFAARESLSLALTIAVSSLSYVLLEKPFLRLKQRFTRVHSRPV